MMASILNFLFFGLQITVILSTLYFFIDFKKRRKLKLQNQKKTHT